MKNVCEFGIDLANMEHDDLLLDIHSEDGSYHLPHRQAQLLVTLSRPLSRKKTTMQRAICRIPVRHLTARKSAGAFSTQVRNISVESYTDRQAKTGRPVSPHVTIYR